MVWMKRIQCRIVMLILTLLLGSVGLCACGLESTQQKRAGTGQGQAEAAEAGQGETEQGQAEAAEAGQGQTGQGETEAAEAGQGLIEQAQTVKLQEENSLAEWEESLEEGDPAELSAEAVRGMSVVRDGETCFAVSYEPRTYKNTFDCWAISEPYQSMAVVDTEAMYEYFHLLTDMELQLAEGVSSDQTGLEDSENSLYVAYYRGQTEQGGQAAPDRGIFYRFGGKDEAGNYYVEAGGKIWTAQADKVERLFAVNPYDQILKVVSVVNVESIAKVEVTFAEQCYEMRVGEETFQFGDRVVDSAAFYELYTELMSVFIEKALPEETVADNDRELLMTIVYHRNTGVAPQIIQRYYVYDDTYASVQVNNTEFFLVSRKGLEQLQDKISIAFADGMD